jgi:hypothetical protein
MCSTAKQQRQQQIALLDAALLSLAQQCRAPISMGCIHVAVITTV